MKLRRVVALLIAMTLLMAFAPASASAANPIVLQCWVYYNGLQEQEFERLLSEFNDTVGMEEGIYVDYTSKSSVGELAERVRASAGKEVGAEPMPDLFASYADVAYEIKQLGVVADLSAYLTQDELDAYVDAYIDEGRLDGDGGLYIFPVAKSTELLLLNQTAWNEFATATGADAEKLNTWEGLVELGHAYFDWTDAQTPDVQGDGSAFYGRDAVANYLLTGSYQLGGEIFHPEDDGTISVQLDKAVLRRLWDMHYVPHVSGWFGAYGRFRSDDIKTGQIIALVGSTSGAVYFPAEVTYDDGTTAPIECSVHSLPNFEGTAPAATQQGAGFVVSKSDAAREQAAVTFLQWFTAPEQNVRFALGSGYLPVTKAGNTVDVLEASMAQQETSETVREIMYVGAQIVNDYHLYTNRPFESGYAMRTLLENSFTTATADGLAQRLALQDEGMSYADAVAQMTSDDVFESYYQQLLLDAAALLGDSTALKYAEE